MVTIRKAELYFDYFVTLYVQYESKIFKLKRYREVDAIGVEESEYEFEPNFIAMAKDAVRVYENRIKRQRKKEDLLLKNIERFDNWDGIV